MAGSGKTTLAVHLATALADEYPDAQLYIDLHGHSERTPLTPAAAVATLLRQLGVPAERVPMSQDDRLALWRSELAGRRALLVLDNAATADQVTPLLPNGSHCLILITSRRRLVGVDEGRPSSLPVLDSDEAVELLGRVVGVARVAAEPEAATEVVRRCGHLPLAIRLAGARLAHRPHWRIADLAERLASRPDPLAEFEVGERSVGRAFALSYAQVSPVAQRAFRLLGLHPGVRFDTRWPPLSPGSRFRRRRTCSTNWSTRTWSRRRSPAATGCTTSCGSTRGRSSPSRGGRVNGATASNVCSIITCTSPR